MKNKSLSIFIAIIVLIITYSIYRKINRSNKLKENTFNTTAYIEKIVMNTIKGSNGRKDIVYFYFLKNDTIYHKLKDLKNYESRKRNLKLKDGFQIKISNMDFDIWELDLNSPSDTLFIDKLNYKNHIYNTFIHRNIIE